MNYSELCSILFENSIDFSMKKGDNNKGKVYLRMQEGDNLPHCHIKVHSLGGNICLTLRNPPRYFKHQEFRNEFSNNKCKKLFNIWLDMKCTTLEAKQLNLTNWEFLKYRWNLAHRYTSRKSCIPNNMKHPNYTKLP